jgi:AcrR family transcriptional regulator
LRRRRGLLRGGQNVSRSFVAHNQRERILDAVANLSVAKGFGKLTVEDIAEEAAVSLAAFYEHFGGKEEAFLVAYEVGHAKGLALVEREYAAQSDWPSAVRVGIETLFEFLASEPAFSRLALIEALCATSRSAERSYLGVGAFADLLVPGVEALPGGARLPATTIEAITGGIFELCLQYCAEGRIAELPRLGPSATYFALAPFLGGEQAAQIALAGGA